MVYSEDLSRIFGGVGESLAIGEITLFGTSALVVSGHKGLSSLSSAEIVVRRKGGNLRITGESLRLVKAGPAEIYIAGEIRAVECVAPLSEVEH